MEDLVHRVSGSQSPFWWNESPFPLLVWWTDTHFVGWVRGCVEGYDRHTVVMFGRKAGGRGARKRKNSSDDGGEVEV